MRNLITNAKAAHLEMRVRRFLLLGCAFSLLGLRYSLRKPIGGILFYVQYNNHHLGISLLGWFLLFRGSPRPRWDVIRPTRKLPVCQIP